MLTRKKIAFIHYSTQGEKDSKQVHNAISAINVKGFSIEYIRLDGSKSACNPKTNNGEFDYKTRSIINQQRSFEAIYFYYDGPRVDRSFTEFVKKVIKCDIPIPHIFLDIDDFMEELLC